MRGIFSVRAGAAVAALAVAGAAGAVAATPGAASAATAGGFRYPTVTVHLTARAVPTLSLLGAALHVSSCVSHVSAYAVNLASGQVLVSTTDNRSGELARVAFAIPATAAPGTYELAGAYGRPCGAKSGTEQLDPAAGHFSAAFTVVTRG